MRRMYFAALSAFLAASCSNQVVTPTPPLTSANVQTVDKALPMKPKSVTITEIPLPSKFIGPLAVGADGSVYLGSIQSLYRYFNGAFTSTLPYDALNPNCFLPSYTKPCGTNVDAITAVGLPQVVWAAEYIQQGVASGWAQLEYGGFGDVVTAPPGFTESTKLPPTSVIGSIVVAPDKTIWLGGSTRAPLAFSHDVPYGRPAKLPSMYQQGDLILTNGPHHHIWGAIVHPAGGSPVFEFAADGSVVHTFAAPYSAEVGDIVGDEHGLWFTDYNNNAIGHMTDKGVVSEIPLPTPNSDPLAIAESVDGSLWFTEIGGVGRLDNKRHFTEFKLPGVAPIEIAALPAGPGCNPDVVYVVGRFYPNLVKITF